MKKTFKLIGIIALVAIVEFSMAACSDDSGGSGGGGGGNTPGGGGGGGGGSGTASIIGTWDIIDEATNAPHTGFYAARFEFTANSFDYYESSKNPEHCASGTWTKDGSVIIATISSAYNPSVTFNPGTQYTISFKDNNNIHARPLDGTWRRRR
jgi:hypothetical protein